MKLWADTNSVDARGACGNKPTCSLISWLVASRSRASAATCPLTSWLDASSSRASVASCCCRAEAARSVALEAASASSAADCSDDFRARSWASQTPSKTACLSTCRGAGTAAQQQGGCRNSTSSTGRGAEKQLNGREHLVRHYGPPPEFPSAKFNRRRTLSQLPEYNLS